MDTVPRKQGPQHIEQDQAAPGDPEAMVEMCAFMACEAFTPFVLDCLAQAARDAAAEHATQAAVKRQSE
jgi:tetrahydromethanopterin S-methyltransferase subunit H